MKRSLAVIAVLTIAFLVGCMVYFASFNRQPGHVDALKILTAARTYTANLRAEGLPVPASVSLQELINRRLLTASDVSGFTGMEVTINLSADDTRPQDILIRAHLEDGQEIVTLADGSVQQLSPNRGICSVTNINTITNDRSNWIDWPPPPQPQGGRVF